MVRAAALPLMCFFGALVACTPPAIPPGDAGLVAEVDAGLDAGVSLTASCERRPVTAWPVDSFFETDALSAGSGQVLLWSEDHYTAPIQGSEVWWPWCLVGPGRAWCSTSAPFETVDLGVFFPDDPTRLERSVVMAGSLAEGVLYGLDGQVFRVRDGGVQDGGVRLPARWRVGEGYALDAIAGALTPEAALLDGRLAWSGADGGVWLIELDTGAASRLSDEPRVVAVALGTGFEAWRTDAGITRRSDAGLSAWPSVAQPPALVGVGPWLLWAERDVVLAHHLDGRQQRLEFPRDVVALAADGCDVFAALTPPDAGASDRVYRFSPGP